MCWGLFGIIFCFAVVVSTRPLDTNVLFLGLMTNGWKLSKDLVHQRLEKPKLSFSISNPLLNCLRGGQLALTNDRIILVVAGKDNPCHSYQENVRNLYTFKRP